MIGPTDIPRVYFAQLDDDGLIKIGTTRNIPQRLQQLHEQVHGPLRLLASMPGGHAREHVWHKRFAHLQLFSEWFIPKPELTQAITALPADPHESQCPSTIGAYIPVEMHDALTAEAKLRGVSTSTVLRSALAKYLSTPHGHPSALAAVPA